MFTRFLIALFAAVFLWHSHGYGEPGAVAAAPDELRTSAGGKVWVYLPKNTPVEAKLACVLIAPAGTRLFHGVTLGEGDKPEHLPWVAAGFAVVSYDLSAPLPEHFNNAQAAQAAADFMKAKFGVSDGLAALDAALVKYPQIDPNRIYVAGHSSAATLALQLAAASDRFKGCVGFAPVTDLEGYLGKFLLVFDRATPGFAAAFRAASPINETNAIKCPVFLFHAQNDDRVTTTSVEAYRDALLKSHKTVEYVTVASGGHYASMIREGVPKATAWVKALDRKQASSKP